jgi:hypothetical protein
MAESGEQHVKSHPSDPKRTGSPRDDDGGRGTETIQGGGTVPPDSNVRIPPDRGGDS